MVRNQRKSDDPRSVFSLWLITSPLSQCVRGRLHQVTRQAALKYLVGDNSELANLS